MDDHRLSTANDEHETDSFLRAPKHDLEKTAFESGMVWRAGSSWQRTHSLTLSVTAIVSCMLTLLIAVPITFAAGARQCETSVETNSIWCMPADLLANHSVY